MSTTDVTVMGVLPSALYVITKYYIIKLNKTLINYLVNIIYEYLWVHCERFNR